MDTKNDDSGGSDSLDKSLQKKCVVDDVGQGEGTASKEATSSSGTSSQQQRPCNSMKKQKTEKHVGDGGCGNECNAPSIQQDVNQPTASNTTPSDPRGRSSYNASNANIATSTIQPTTSNCTATAAANCNSQFSTNNAFETKVKQISKNLKETTLAETATSNSENLTDDSTSASMSSTASNATSPESSETAASTNDNPDEPAVDMDGTPLNTSMISDSNDDADNRSKKVRFHPDVKENDGGNRVIPKKKKKLKASTGSDDPTTSQQQGAADDEMDLDEEEDYEEEDEFDLAKTIAEAQDYLKEHPLTFVRPCDKSAGRLQNGLLEEDDLPQVSEPSEEEYCEEVIPENGIERILGKQTKGGRVEFLLRFTNQPGLFWESEDFVATQCPSLLTQYEHIRERRQERLMRHVAKRQNLRQRYTDF